MLKNFTTVHSKHIIRPKGESLVNRSIWLPVIALIGVLCLALGIYSLLHKSNSAAVNSATSNTEIAQGQIFVNQPWTSVGRFKGKILVLMSGEANLHPRLPKLGPAGNAQPAESTYPLPGANVFSSIAKHDGQVEKVGSSKEFYFPSETELFLGVNDEVGQQHGPGFSDNSGFWSYRILPVKPDSVQVVVLGTDKWKDSGLRVNKGQRITIAATGSVVWEQNQPAVGPSGTFPANTVQQPSDFPAPDAGCGSLLMKIGTTVHPIGAGDTITSTDSGAVLFMVNDRLNYLFNNSGSFTVKVDVQ
jgi:PA-IL-like protein